MFAYAHCPGSIANVEEAIARAATTSDDAHEQALANAGAVERLTDDLTASVAKMVEKMDHDAGRNPLSNREHAREHPGGGDVGAPGHTTSVLSGR